MKSTLFFLAAVPAAFAGILNDRAACNADNCARALTGTVSGTPQAQSRISTDCKSFQTATFYPSATTVTVTQGSVSNTVQPGTANTVVSPTALPSYAQRACTGNASSRFASACSCAGVTRTTSTATTPTVTVIVPTQSSVPAQECDNPGYRNTCNRQAADGGPCYCNPSSEGGKCTGTYYCTGDAQSCTVDSDCPSNFCAQGACPESICVPSDAVASCANPSAPGRLFRVRGTGRNPNDV